MEKDLQILIDKALAAGASAAGGPAGGNRPHRPLSRGHRLSGGGLCPDSRRRAVRPGGPPRRGRFVRRGNGGRTAAGKGAAVRSVGPGLGARPAARPAARLVRALPHPLGGGALRHAQVALPGAGGGLGLVLQGLSGARF